MSAACSPSAATSWTGRPGFGDAGCLSDSGTERTGLNSRFTKLRTVTWNGIHGRVVSARSGPFCSLLTFVTDIWDICHCRFSVKGDIIANNSQQVRPNRGKSANDFKSSTSWQRHAGERTAQVGSSRFWRRPAAHFWMRKLSLAPSARTSVTSV